MFDPVSNRIALIDFGAAHDFSEDFMEGYKQLVLSAAEKDLDAMMKMSIKLGFLSGDESDVMMKVCGVLSAGVLCDDVVNLCAWPSAFTSVTASCLSRL